MLQRISALPRYAESHNGQKGRMFENRRYIEWPSEAPPQLVVVVDTEEEFDWTAEPDTAARQVTAMDYIGRAQDIFNDYGIRPCYVIDYPIASQTQGYRKLREFVDRGQCEICAHLHPWVNPPVREKLTRANTYPGNLPAPLEREKLMALRSAGPRISSTTMVSGPVTSSITPLPAKLRGIVSCGSLLTGASVRSVRISTPG